MTFFDAIETKKLTLCNDDGPVVDFDLIPNTETPLPGHTRGRVARIRAKMRGSFPFEMWTEPGDEADILGNVINQIGLFGLLPPDGKGRKRLTMSVVNDNEGNVEAIIDSTTTDPSGHIGQKDAAPFAINAGEGRGQYVILYPADAAIRFIDRATGADTEKIPFTRLIKHLTEIK